jgi:PPOX class probable F420-dependent enzyme
MPDQESLWRLIAARRQGVLATINADGTPQLSNILYVVDDEHQAIRITTTADRVKSRNLARDPRAALHVLGEDFWQFAVAEGDVSLSAIAAAPGDAATQELFEVHSTFYGELDRAAFDLEMIEHKRLIVRLHVNHLYGIIATGGRRPVAADG